MKLPRISTLTPMLFYAASGGAYALANLLLARRLAEREYAVFTLVLTMMTLAPALAAAGLDSVAVRGGLRFVPRVGRRVWAAAAVVAAVLTLASVQLSLAATAWADLATRPAEKVNGSKGKWALITLINFVGPIWYFRKGRRA